VRVAKKQPSILRISSRVAGVLIAANLLLTTRSVLSKDRVCVVTGCGNSPLLAAVDAFIAKLVQIYEGHGGVFAPHPTHGKKPWVGVSQLSDEGELVANAWNKTGNRYNAPPMFMIFIINDRNVELYRRIRKSCDNCFSVASQVLQSRHALTASTQYIPNAVPREHAEITIKQKVAEAR
jgi:eukaryotic translation initiation factor 2C